MIKILVAGDFVPCGRTVNLVDQKDKEQLFGDFLPVLVQTDFNVINLECPIVVREYTKGIKKNGPLLKTNNNTAEVLREAGFNLATLANNHFYDYGDVGVEDTLSVCRAAGIQTVGGGKNLTEASDVFFCQLQGKRFAFINVCEHEFSIATAFHGGSNPLDPVNNFYQIRQVRDQADYVIVIIHGGHEMYPLPSPGMQNVYRFLADAGADVIVNHHPHCYSGYEIYNQTPIFYSLGNFSFDEEGNGKGWNEGFAVMLGFENGKVSFELFPYVQGDRCPGIRFMNEEEKMKFERTIKKLNGIIDRTDELTVEFQKFCVGKKKNVLSCFEPYSNRFLKALYVRNLLPSFLKKEQMLNMIQCEAHREVIIQVLKDVIYN